jgi:hypothetical protein
MNRKKEIMKKTVMKEVMYFLKMKRSKKRSTSKKMHPVTWIHPTVKNNLHKTKKKSPAN